MTDILYLSYDGMTDQLGQSQVLPYLEGLSKKGYTIHLISFEKREKFRMLENQIRTICKNAGIIWHPINYTKKPPVLSTLYDLYKMRSACLKLFKANHFQLVHCRSYLPGMIGLYLQKKFDVKFLFDIRGFWADERVEGNIWNLNNPVFKIIYRYMKKKEQSLLNAADAVISLTQKAVPIIRKIQNAEGNAKPLFVIPCCVDTDLFDFSKVTMTQQESMRQRIGLSDQQFILTYLGGISTWYLPGEMLDFFVELLKKYADARFLFITQEDEKHIFRLAASKNIPLENIKVLSAQRKEVPLLLSISNASIFFIKPSFSKQASSPTKQGEIMSMGIQLISNQGIGDTDAIIRSTDSGFICSDFTPEIYHSVICCLEKNIDHAKKSAIREGAMQFYSLENGINSYTQIYRQLLHQE